MADAKPHNDLSLAIRVPRVHDRIHVGAVAKIFDDLKLLSHTRVHAFFVVSAAQLKTKFLGDAGQIFHTPVPVCLGGSRRIGLDIHQ